MSEILVAAFLCFWTRCPEAGRRDINRVMEREIVKGAAL